MKTNREKSQFILSVFNFFLTSNSGQKDESLSQLAITLDSSSDFYKAVSQVKSKYDIFKEIMFSPSAMNKALEHWLEMFLETN